jgi:diguanylate cyclase (GGDEF)-like protein/PAS domain S-box-containing protein
MEPTVEQHLLPKHWSSLSSRLSALLVLLLIPCGLVFYEWWRQKVMPGLGGLRPSLLAPLFFGSCLTALVAAANRLRLRKCCEDAKQLRQRYALLHKVLEDIPDQLAVIDRKYRIHFSNWGGGYGYVPEERRRGHPRCYEVYYPEQTGPCETCHVRDVFATREPQTRIKHNPNIGFVEIRAFPVFNEKGQVIFATEQICDVSHRIEAEKAIRESEKKLQAILQSIGEPIQVVDRDLIITWANQAAHDLFGRDILSQNCCVLFEERINREECTICPSQAAMENGKPHETILELPVSNGQIRVFKTASHVIRWDENRKPAEVLQVFWDITRIKRAEEALRKSEMLFRTVVDSSDDAMVAINELGRITLFNPGAERIFGRTREEMLNAPVEELMPAASRAEHRTHVRKYFAGNKLPAAVGKTLELSALRSSGEEFPIELSLSEGHLESERFMLAVIRDITERKLFEQQLILQANYDGLTGLPNRNLLLERLKQAIAFEQRNQNRLAVMLLDLDKFKTVNDTLGHEGGNNLLKEVALRLSAAVRAIDTVGRLYGDEFVIVLNDIKDTDAVLRVVGAMDRAFEKPFSIAGSQLLVTFSLGIALFPDDGASAEDLLKKADTAMYSSKDSGRNSFSFFARQMEERLQKRLQLEKLLQKAVINREFFLHYQPRVEGASGRIVGMEALLRWQPDGYGPFSPDQFVPVLEEAGWIKDVGEWILETACRTAKGWHDRGFASVRLWVNISGKQFLEKNLYERIEQILDETGFDPQCLGLELTESVIMQDVEGHIPLLKQLKRLGLLISLDDFGTGYSSLSYLKRLPIDEIKIDRSFINGLIVDENDTAIVRTILAMARSLGIRVVAEGVETPRQYEYLVRHRCDEMQGYLFSKPLPPEYIGDLF